MEATRRGNWESGREEKRRTGKLVASLLRMQDTPYTSCLVISGLRGGDTERMMEREREKRELYSSILNVQVADYNM